MDQSIYTIRTTTTPTIMPPKTAQASRPETRDQIIRNAFRHPLATLLQDEVREAMRADLVRERGYDQSGIGVWPSLSEATKSAMREASAKVAQGRETDEAALAALAKGSLTRFDLAHKLGLSNNGAYECLLRLEREGKVRSERVKRMAVWHLVQQ